MGEIVEVDSKGRIVIPSSIRNKLGVREGTQFKGDEIVLHRILEEVVDQTEPDNLKNFLTDS